MISGRLDDAINIGGTKIAPEIIQMIAAQTFGVGQVAARKVKGADGQDALGLLVVPDQYFDPEQLRMAVATTLKLPAKIVIKTRETFP